MGDTAGRPGEQDVGQQGDPGRLVRERILQLAEQTAEGLVNEARVGVTMRIGVGQGTAVLLRVP
jgi:hypothetical protein